MVLLRCLVGVLIQLSKLVADQIENRKKIKIETLEHVHLFHHSAMAISGVRLQEIRHYARFNRHERAYQRARPRRLGRIRDGHKSGRGRWVHNALRHASVSSYEEQRTNTNHGLLLHIPRAHLLDIYIYISVTLQPPQFDSTSRQLTILIWISVFYLY